MLDGAGWAGAAVGVLGPGVGVVAPGLRSSAGSAVGGWSRRPVGFQNSAIRSELGFLCGWLVVVEQAAQDGSTRDPLGWSRADRVLGAWWS